MTGLLSNFDLALRLAGLVVAVFVIAAAVVASRTAPGARVVAAARLLAVGAVATTLTASLMTPGGITFGHHQLALAPGSGGLGEVGQLLRDPTSLPALLQVFNVLLYIPIGLLVAIGWDDDGRGPARAAVVGAATTLGVELAQWQFTERLASTDDVLLNLAGVALGTGIAVLVRRSPFDVS